MHYRNWKIERVIGATWMRTEPDKKTGLPKARRSKIDGWLLHYPDGGTKWTDTLAEAREYIDQYQGAP